MKVFKGDTMEDINRLKEEIDNLSKELSTIHKENDKRERIKNIKVFIIKFRFLFTIFFQIINFNIYPF